jgi:hypothetical protein
MDGLKVDEHYWIGHWRNIEHIDHIRYRRCEHIGSGPAQAISTSPKLLISGIHTVDVISAEQTSHTYFTPPSPPLAATFFLMTPILLADDEARLGDVIC